MAGWIAKALCRLGLNRPRTTYGQRTVNPASADADCLVIVSKHDACGLQCGILLLVNGVMLMEGVLAFTAVLFYSDESSSSLALAQRRPRSHWVAGWGLVGIDSAPPRYGVADSAPWMDRSPRFPCTGLVSWRLFVSTSALDVLPKASPALVPCDHVCFAHRRDALLAFQA